MTPKVNKRRLIKNLSSSDVRCEKEILFQLQALGSIYINMKRKKEKVTRMRGF
jgi:hypothetical protein